MPESSNPRIVDQPVHTSTDRTIRTVYTLSGTRGERNSDILDAVTLSLAHHLHFLSTSHLQISRLPPPPRSRSRSATSAHRRSPPPPHQHAEAPTPKRGRAGPWRRGVGGGALFRRRLPALATPTRGSTSAATTSYPSSGPSCCNSRVSSTTRTSASPGERGTVAQPTCPEAAAVGMR